MKRKELGRYWNRARDAQTWKETVLILLVFLGGVIIFLSQYHLNFFQYNEIDIASIQGNMKGRRPSGEFNYHIKPLDLFCAGSSLCAGDKNFPRPLFAGGGVLYWKRHFPHY